MRQFKIKNLLIKILPETFEEGVDQLAGRLRDFGVMDPLHLICGCTLNLTAVTRTRPCCGGCSDQPSGVCLPCTIITDVAKPSLGLEDLILLKAQLKLQLQEIEVREKLQEEQLRVHTAEEANELEQNLTEALRQVKQLKETLPKEPGPGK